MIGTIMIPILIAGVDKLTAAGVLCSPMVLVILSLCLQQITMLPSSTPFETIYQYSLILAALAAVVFIYCLPLQGCW